MSYNIPYGRHKVEEKDIQSVVAVLRSDWLTQGPKINEFEAAFAKYVGAKYAVAVSNGTAALHISALAMDVNEGDKVITTPISFSASANCVRYCNGEVIFSDIDKNTYLSDFNKIEDLLKKSKGVGFKGIIAVDFAGNPTNLEELRLIADRYDLWIIEDACHAPGGAFYDTRNEKQLCGNGKFADLAIFSFHPVKHIASGEGGMITTNNELLYKKLLRLRTHGITKDPILLEENHGDWYYEMHDLGFNYRLTDIQAALGLSQLVRADINLKIRQKIAFKYTDSFKELPVTPPSIVKDYLHAFHLYIIKVSERKELYNYLKKHGIFTQVHYIPIHLHPYYKKFGWRKGDMPVAEEYYSQCLSLPMYPSLSDNEQRYVMEKIKDFYT